jgi:hypothetical protein
LTLAAAALAAAGPASAQGPQIEPPAPPNLYTSLTEAELVAQLPERERTHCDARRDPRDRYEALLAAADSLLARAQVEAQAQGAVASTLQLYEAVVMAADRRLRSPEAAVKPRDRLFKRYERRLADHLKALKPIVATLAHQEFDTGTAVAATVARLRVGALNSALDIDDNILQVPAEAGP